MLKFKKWFRSKNQDLEIAKEKIIADNVLEQEDKDSAEQSYEQLSINEGQIGITSTRVMSTEGALLVGFFVSNGVNQKVRFDTVPLVLLDSQKRVLARQTFDGESIGEIAKGSSKACVVRFDQCNVHVKDMPEDCQVCFDVPAKQTGRIQISYQSLPEAVTEVQREELERVLEGLPPVKPGEVNVSPLKAQITSQSDLVTTVIIRNAAEKVINLERLPLVVFDAQHVELARGQFEIENLSIEPFKAIIWTFNFGAISQDRYPDLSVWHLNVIQ